VCVSVICTHTWQMCHVMHTNQSRHTNEWTTSHEWTNHTSPLCNSFRSTRRFCVRDMNSFRDMNSWSRMLKSYDEFTQHTATHSGCNTLQHTATRDTHFLYGSWPEHHIHSHPVCSVWYRHLSANPTRLVIATHTSYGVATISRLLKIIGLFCKRAL